MRYCPNDRCPRHLRAEPGAAEVGACPFCRTPLVDTPRAEPGAAPPEAPLAWLEPVAATAGLAGFVALLRWLPLPFVDTYLGSHRGLFHNAALSPAALGVAPVVSGFMLVELASLVTAAGRAARETSDGRARMIRRAWVVSAAVALFQTFTLWRSLSAMPELFSGHASLDADPQRLALGASAAIFVGFVALVALARAADRRGLGAGLAVVTAVTLGAEQLGALAPPPGDDFVPLRLAALLLVAGGAAAGTAAVLRQRYTIVRVGEAPKEGGYRVAARSASAEVLSMRAPLGGVVPVSLAVMGTHQLSAFTDGDLLPSVATHAPGRALVLGALACGLALLTARWFHSPRRVAATAGALGDTRPLAEREADARLVWRAGLRSTLAFTVGITVGEVAALRLGSPLDVTSVATVTAIVLDLAEELRLRRARGPLAPLRVDARVMGADAVSARLALAGVPAFVRNGHVRALLHWFAPHLTLTVLVPEADLARARDVLGAVAHAPSAATSTS